MDQWSPSHIRRMSPVYSRWRYRQTTRQSAHFADDKQRCIIYHHMQAFAQPVTLHFIIVAVLHRLSSSTFVQLSRRFQLSAVLSQRTTARCVYSPHNSASGWRSGRYIRLEIWGWFPRTMLPMLGFQVTINVTSTLPTAVAQWHSG